MTQRPPKISIITKRLDRGGAETHLLRVVPQLRARGLDVSLVVLERGGRLEPNFVAQGVPVIGPEPSRGRARRIGRAAHAILQHLRHDRVDVVHCFLPEPYLIGGLVARFVGVPVRIMSRRSLNDYQRRYSFFFGPLERHLHAGTTVLLGNSSAVVDQLRAECGTPAKVGLIHNGIELHALTARPHREIMRGALGIAPDTFVITIVANLIAYKGHSDLIAALAIADKALPPSWILLVSGRDDGIGTALGAQARAAGIGDHIRWLGERGDTMDLLGCSDLGIVASHEEGFSNSLIEAMSCGLPMVVTAVGGNVDAVIHDQSGRLVSARAPPEMAAVITSLASDPEARRRLGTGARQRVRTLFTLDGCVARYENLYRGLDRLGHEPVQTIIEGGIVTADRQV
jgi:glycosyltransferase involved in cell wall biosynthesis